MFKIQQKVKFVHPNGELVKADDYVTNLYEYDIRNSSRIDGTTSIGLQYEKEFGTVVAMSEIKNNENTYMVLWTNKEGKPMCLGFKESRLVDAGAKRGRPSKPKPVVKHVVLKDSCSNLIGFKDSYEAALEIAKPSASDGQFTVYKLVPVATVKTETLTKVSKVVSK